MDPNNMKKQKWYFMFKFYSYQNSRQKITNIKAKCCSNIL